MNTTFTFRTDDHLKEQAQAIFENSGLTMTTAINLFLRQAVIKKRFPLSIEAEACIDATPTYPKGFFDFFGSMPDGGIDEEPEDLPLSEVRL